MTLGIWRYNKHNKNGGYPMARIRKLSIRNFRSIKTLDWTPSPGINCLIGPGDSGKSSILDAIDLCLSARRSVPFGDTDFYNLDVRAPIIISVTLGELSEDLMNLDTYGDFLRGFDSVFDDVVDEPAVTIETVLTLQLKVESDLEPQWTLYSERAEQLGLSRGLAWKDRTSLAPARIGAYAQTNLSWARGSVLNRLTEERAELGPALANAAREARSNFGNQAADQLNATLEVVARTAADLGVPIGKSALALLDAHSVSIGDGAIALHSEAGIPLRSLGTGSSRLLIAGLQRAAANAASIALVDEVEYGLEPHRLIRFLDSLGAKASNPPLQVFLTTHSPVALKELLSNQLFIVRSQQGNHTVLRTNVYPEVQGILRSAPEAFLAKYVLVCEGASEVGLIRGMDQYRSEKLNLESINARGAAYYNVGGGSPDNCFLRGKTLLNLGYPVIVLVDADKPPLQKNVQAFIDAGGKYVMWQNGNALEDELFKELHDAGIDTLLAMAKEFVGAALVSQQISSMSANQFTLEAIEASRPQVPYSPAVRALLGRVSKNSSNAWFKSITAYQRVGNEAVLPHCPNSSQAFQNSINELWGYINAAGA
ncbi:ATP-dependent nuclease [Herbaspirillum robiniae]|uniref:ATP-dependent nuclease n=1 Tax=Herbaspirillum robiniae TaxID=2014887 RepID=UPI001EDA2277|nr:AAA family ATPase [Herbaspirillum robiniae]